MAQEMGDWSIAAAYWLNIIALIICIIYGIINISRKDENSSGRIRQAGQSIKPPASEKF